MPFVLLIVLIIIVFLCMSSELPFFKALLKAFWIFLSFISSIFVFTKIEEGCKGWFHDCSAPVHLVALIPITGVTLYIFYLLRSKMIQL